MENLAFIYPADAGALLCITKHLDKGDDFPIPSRNLFKNALLRLALSVCMILLQLMVISHEIGNEEYLNLNMRWKKLI